MKRSDISLPRHLLCTKSTLRKSFATSSIRMTAESGRIELNGSGEKATCLSGFGDCSSSSEVKSVDSSRSSCDAAVSSTIVHAAIEVASFDTLDCFPYDETGGRFGSLSEIDSSATESQSDISITNSKCKQRQFEYRSLEFVKYPPKI